MTRSQTRTIDFGASNLRGSPVPLFLAGTRILGSYPLGPRTGCALDGHDALVLRRRARSGSTSIPPRSPTSTAFMGDVRDAFAEIGAFA